MPFTIEYNFLLFKALVRDNIVQAVVQAPEVIRIQLSVCISMIIKHDFPHKWPQVVDHISIHLETGGDNWLGALICLYQLVKNYEYKKKEERAPLNDAMNLLLPMIYKIFTGTIQGKLSKLIYHLPCVCSSVRVFKN